MEEMFYVNFEEFRFYLDLSLEFLEEIFLVFKIYILRGVRFVIFLIGCVLVIEVYFFLFREFFFFKGFFIEFFVFFGRRGEVERVLREYFEFGGFL